MTKETSQFQIVGHYEDVFDATDPKEKFLGSRRCEAHEGREFGLAGKREETWTADVQLDRGHKKVTLEASEAEPVRVFTILKKLCGPANYAR